MQAIITRELVKSLKPEAKPYEVRDPRLKGFLLRVQPSGVMTYYAEYGRGKRHRVGPADALAPSQAREEAKRVLAGVALGDDPAAAQRGAKAHTLRSFLDDVYEPWARANIRTPRNTLGRLRANFPDLQNKKLGEINTWLVEKGRSARLKAGAKATTVNRDLDDLRSALGKAVAWGLLEAHPLAGVKRSRTDDNATVRYLDDDEEQRLRGALDAREERIRAGRDRANAWRVERGYPTLPDLRRVEFTDHLKPMVLVSINTGVRRGELFSLEWCDVDLQRAMLTVRGQSAKSGRTRHIPLNAEALAALQGWRDQRSVPDGLVFSSRNGERLDNTWKAWVGVLADAKIKGFRWHDQRHHFASRLVMAGVDLNTVRELLGHASYQMTLRYAHLAPKHKAAAVAKLVRAGVMESRDEQVATLEVLYRQSKENVSYVWEALAEFGPDEPLPAWIRSYLAEAAHRVAALIYQIEPSPEPKLGPPTEALVDLPPPPPAKRLTPKQAVERVPAALGFTKPGGRLGNAFKARREAERNADLAWKYELELAKQAGNSDQLKDAAARVLSLSTKNKSSIERRIRRGRGILKAQETAKKKG